MQGPLGPVQADHAAHPDGGAGGDEAKRAFDAMMIMKKIDVAVMAAAVAALIDGSPGALDTFNELAAALGDDANFAA